MTERKTWTPADVVDASGPPALLRNYLEQRDVRAFFRQVLAAGPVQRAYDVGCGFGRLTPVLAEAATEVVGFEREEALLSTARQLLPDLTFVNVASLEQLPVDDRSAQFAMTFTVLQHMPDQLAVAVIGELKRVVGPHGHVLLVEETDPAVEAGDPGRADLGYTRGRPVAWYAERLSPYQLIATAPRLIEPGYPRTDVGTYMLFAGA